MSVVHTSRLRIEKHEGPHRTAHIENFPGPINFGIHVLHAPPALGGFLVSALVLFPESVSAARAALANQLQRSVNILLGSVLATIGLTIPAVLTIGLITKRYGESNTTSSGGFLPSSRTGRST